jgi:hypothetical protein
VDLYWYKTGADAHWETLEGNWWEDAAHTIQSSRIPEDGDFVYYISAVAPGPINPPVEPVALIGFDSTACEGNFNASTLTTVSIQEGGTLRLGSPGKSQDWGGTTGATGTFIFNCTSHNGGTVGDGAVFNDEAANAGYAGDYAVFNDDAYNSGSGLGDYATFNDNAGNRGPLGDYATFNDYSSNENTAGDHALFYGDSRNTATVGNFAGFYGNSSSYGPGNTVGDYALFGDNSWASGVTLGEWFVITSVGSIIAYQMGRTAPLPAESDVRSGVTFGQEQTGALAPAMLVA